MFLMQAIDSDKTLHNIVSRVVIWLTEAKKLPWRYRMTLEPEAKPESVYQKKLSSVYWAKLLKS